MKKFTVSEISKVKMTNSGTDSDPFFFPPSLWFFFLIDDVKSWVMWDFEIWDWFWNWMVKMMEVRGWMQRWRFYFGEGLIQMNESLVQLREIGEVKGWWRLKVKIWDSLVQTQWGKLKRVQNDEVKWKLIGMFPRELNDWSWWVFIGSLNLGIGNFS